MNVPKLRFKDDGREFPEWQIVSINDADVKVIDGDRGTNYPNGNDFSSDGYCLFLNAKNVTKSGFVFDEVSFITKEKDEKLRKGKLRRNDLIITTRGSVGNIAFYNHDINFENVRINSGMVILRIESTKIDAKYLYQYFYSPNFTQLVQKIAFGSAQPQLTVLEIKKFTIGLPLLQEQTRIANFLTAVDEKITQLTQKSDLLAQYKKGVMQKIFNQELRFKDEDGREFPEWEVRKLNDFLIERNIQNPKSEKYPLMAFIAHKGVSDKGDRYDREFLVNNEDSKKYKQTEYGDFIYSSNNLETGSIGLNNYGSATISPVYSIFRITELCNRKFISCLFSRKEFINKMIRWRQGVVYGQWRIHESDFLKIEEKIPCLTEQTKIANFLNTIDDKINQTQAELDAVKQYKQGLLQQMFV